MPLKTIRHLSCATQVLVIVFNFCILFQSSAESAEPCLNKCADQNLHKNLGALKAVQKSYSTQVCRAETLSILSPNPVTLKGLIRPLTWKSVENKLNTFAENVEKQESKCGPSCQSEFLISALILAHPSKARSQSPTCELSGKTIQMPEQLKDISQVATSLDSFEARPQSVINIPISQKTSLPQESEAPQAVMGPFLYKAPKSSNTSLTKEFTCNDKNSLKKANEWLTDQTTDWARDFLKTVALFPPDELKQHCPDDACAFQVFSLMRKKTIESNGKCFSEWTPYVEVYCQPKNDNKMQLKMEMKELCKAK